MRKIYGILTQRQKDVIRESMKSKKIIKKENLQKIGADNIGKTKFLSPYAIDQEKSVLQS